MFISNLSVQLSRACYATCSETCLADLNSSYKAAAKNIEWIYLTGRKEQTVKLIKLLLWRKGKIFHRIRVRS